LKADSFLVGVPTSPDIEVKRAHALLLRETLDEAKQLYLKHKDKNCRIM
jgi:hypothetical protein